MDLSQCYLLIYVLNCIEESIDKKGSRLPSMEFDITKYLVWECIAE